MARNEYDKRPDYSGMLGSVSEHLNELRREISGTMNLLATPLMEELGRLRKDAEPYTKSWSYGPRGGRPHHVSWRIHLTDEEISTEARGALGTKRTKVRLKPQLVITFAKVGQESGALPEILYRFSKSGGVSETLHPQDVELVYGWVNTLFDNIARDFPPVMERLEWAFDLARRLQAAGVA